MTISEPQVLAPEVERREKMEANKEDGNKCRVSDSVVEMMKGMRILQEKVYDRKAFEQWKYIARKMDYYRSKLEKHIAPKRRK